MKICITGIAGAIGSHVAEAFLGLGHEVLGIDVLDPYYDPRIKERTLLDVGRAGGKITILDLALADLTLGIPDDTEVIFHFAAQPGISAGTTFDHYIKNNIIATERLMARALTLPSLSRFVYISTSSVYGKNAIGGEDIVPRPTSHYGVTKLAAEQLALSYHRSKGLPVTSLRLFSVYGPRERPEKLFHKLLHALYHDQAFPLYEGALSHVRSFTAVADVVHAMERILDASHVEGEIINIGSTDTHTTEEGIALIERISGKRAELEMLPPRLGDQSETQADIRKAEQLLGFAPKMKFHDGLVLEHDWYVQTILPLYS
jgi:UDP-glucuronate 4-epimerase